MEKKVIDKLNKINELYKIINSYDNCRVIFNDAIDSLSEDKLSSVNLFVNGVSLPIIDYVDKNNSIALLQHKIDYLDELIKNLNEELESLLNL